MTNTFILPECVHKGGGSSANHLGRIGDSMLMTPIMTRGINWDGQFRRAAEYAPTPMNTIGTLPAIGLSTSSAKLVNVTATSGERAMSSVAQTRINYPMICNS